jgi:hypothetical protein
MTFVDEPHKLDECFGLKNDCTLIKQHCALRIARSNALLSLAGRWVAAATG